jgi:hypothetical protein
MFTHKIKKPLTENTIELELEKDEQIEKIKTYIDYLNCILKAQTEIKEHWNKTSETNPKLAINIPDIKNQIVILNKILKNEAITEEEHHQLLDLNVFKNNQIIHDYANFHSKNYCCIS